MIISQGSTEKHFECKQQYARNSCIMEKGNLEGKKRGNMYDRQIICKQLTENNNYFIPGLMPLSFL